MQYLSSLLLTERYAKESKAKLLARFYDPQTGLILIDGRDLRTIDLAEWRSQVGAVFLDFGRHQLSVQENITVTDSDLNPNHPSTQRILRQSDLLGLVSRLPEGLPTQLGKQFNGTELSGGEWQKVAIARALARNAAALLILDEPTASLDLRSEYELYKDFADLAHGITTLPITYRLGSVRMAEKIYVLEHGRVVEVGNYSALVASGGLHWALVVGARRGGEAPRELGARSLIARLGYSQVNYPVLPTFLLRVQPIVAMR